MTTLSKHPHSKTTVRYSKPDALRLPSIRKWLLRCLKLLETLPAEQRSRRIIDRINASHFPELFDPPDSSADAILWAAILSLDELGVVKLERKSRQLDPHAPPWQSTALVFQPDAEAQVRQWLDRPRVRPDQSAWNNALSEVVDQFADPSLIQTNPFPALNRSPKDILSRLLLIPTLLRRNKATSYQISAELFWGQSKLLRDKEDWLTKLLGLPETAFLPRPLLVEVSFPAKPVNGVLIIENLDSYVAAVDGYWPTGNDLLLIYSQGFKLCAKSIRQAERIRFHVHNQRAPSQSLLQDFKHFWFENSDNRNWPIYAITDMDRDGLRIFSYLKREFPHLEPWKPGYKAMLDAVKNQNYHHPDEAGKTEQRPVDSSGSDWIDQHVLPLVLEDKFVDEEIIQQNTLF